MDEIKLNKLGTHLASAKLQQPIVKQPVETSKIEGVTVTNHMNKLVNLLGGDESSSEENARVLTAKSLVDSGQYKVDVQALSEKLLNSGLLVQGG